MPSYSIRVAGAPNEGPGALVDLPNAAAAERAAIQMLVELQMHAAGAARRVCVYDAAGRPVVDVTLNVFRPPIL